MQLKRKKTDKEDASAAAKAPPRTGPKKKLVGLKKGGKAKQFCLLIGDEGAILVFMEGQKVVRRLFALTPQSNHTEAIVELMQANPKVPISILVDSIDQQYVRQNFPPVSAMSVNGLVKRRLARDFQRDDLNGFLPLMREKTGRKEWQYLLISLAKTAQLSDWINLIIELNNPLTGIFLVPVEAVTYLPLLKSVVEKGPASEWQLLVTHNKVSGFRQVVTHNGKLEFTRVTQSIDDAIPAVIAGNIEQEIINTIEYLKRLDFSDNSNLDIIVICASEVNESLDLKRFNPKTANTLTPLDVAAALGLEQAALSADRFGDVVLAASFLRSKKHTLKLLTPYATKLGKLYSTRKAVFAVTALLILAFIGMSLNNIIEMYSNNAEREDSARKQLAVKFGLEELQKKVDALDKNVAHKSAIVSTYDAYVKAELQPMAFVVALAPNLSAEQHLLSFEWKDDSAVTDKNTAAPKATDPKKADEKISIRAELEFKGAYSDLENLVQSVNAFYEKIVKSMPEYTVTHEQFAWEKETEKGLEITFAQKEEGGIKPGFNRVTFIFSGPHKIDTPAITAQNPAPQTAPAGVAP